MLHATLRSKPGGGNLAFEDALTATVLERLAYLPSDVAWALLNAASPGLSALLKTPEPSFALRLWPWHRLPGVVGAPPRRVQPDAVIDTGSGVVVVEAKRPGLGHHQTVEQWTRELQAVQADGIDVRALLLVEPPEQVPVVLEGVFVCGMRWQTLADVVEQERRQARGPSGRLLDDITAALRSRSLHPFLPLHTVGRHCGWSQTEVNRWIGI